jgi:hypothetical protein
LATRARCHGRRRGRQQLWQRGRGITGGGEDGNNFGNAGGNDEDGEDGNNFGNAGAASRAAARTATTLATRAGRATTSTTTASASASASRRAGRQPPPPAKAPATSAPELRHRHGATGQSSCSGRAPRASFLIVHARSARISHCARSAPEFLLLKLRRAIFLIIILLSLRELRAGRESWEGS